MKVKTNMTTKELTELINEVAQATLSAANTYNGDSINYFRSMESLLYNYKKLAALVENEADYMHVELHDRSTCLVQYSGTGGMAKDRAQIINEMEQQRAASFERTKARFDEIDMIVRLFEDKKEFIVIRMYYFGEDSWGGTRPENLRPYTWEDIAEELSASGILKDEKTARRWRNRLVNDMAICLFGKPAAISAGIYRERRA